MSGSRHSDSAVWPLRLKMNGAPFIDRLRVTHRLTSSDQGEHRLATACLPAAMSSRNVFQLDTCLRKVAIELLPITGLPMRSSDDTEILGGTDAYLLLLEIATGLRSAIPGETNVFGQFRRAWQAFLNIGHPATVAGLTPLMHRLFNDTKAVRKRWLEGVGSSSYGRLVRRLVEPQKQERVLFVGAGELMQSMLPLFEKFRLGVWNRSTVKPMAVPVERFFLPEQGRQAAAWAQHIILTTPQDQPNDLRWREWLISATPRTIVHLGHLHGHQFDWGPGITAFDLDDVFALRRVHEVNRAYKLDRAQIACANLANTLRKDQIFTHRRVTVPGAGLVAA